MPSDKHISLESDRKWLFEENPCAMYIFDTETFQFLAVNKAAVWQYGYSREEFLQLTAKDIRPPGELDKFLRANIKIPDQYVDAGRWLHKRKNGELFIVHTYSHSTEFEGRKANMVLAVNIDEKIKTEKALEEKIHEVENILESITDGFYALNREWKFTYINKEFERVLQCKREDVLGKNVWEIFPATNYLKFYAEYQKPMNEKIPVHFEECYTPLQVWASVNAYPTKEGIAVFFLDITEQKKIQEKLFNDEQSLRAIINNTKDIIWSIDKDFKIVTANKAFWDRVARMSGKSVNEIISDDYAPGLFNAWQEYYIRAFKGEAYKITWIENDGERTTYDEVSFNPVYDRDNQVVGISCFSRDVTEQQTYQDKIEKQNKQLKDIAWLHSHKVRNHLANILGLVNLFDYGNAAEPFNAEIIRLLMQSANNLDTVIKEISANTETL